MKMMTPTEACEMLQSDDADKFKAGLVDGEYGFDDKYLHKNRHIEWSGWMPHIVTEYVWSDGVNEIRIT